MGVQCVDRKAEQFVDLGVLLTGIRHWVWNLQSVRVQEADDRIIQ